VPLQRFQAGLLSSRRQAFDESGLGEGTKLTLVHLCKEVDVLGWGVYPPVILQGVVRVCGPRMRAPVYILTLERGSLGVWEVKDGDFEAIWISVNAYVGRRDMKGGGKRRRDKGQRILRHAQLHKSR